MLSDAKIHKALGFNEFTSEPTKVMLTQIANAAIAAYQAELRNGVELPEDIEAWIEPMTSDELKNAIQQYGDTRDQAGYLRGLEAGFDAGFIASARDWAERDDLIADMESPAYLRDRAAAIEKLNGGE